MILLATDLDRTLLPNGPAPDDGGSARLFAALEKVEHRLAYVTGRNLALFNAAQKEFDIPTPDYLIAAVGTQIYRKGGSTLLEDERWIEFVSSHELSWNRDKITAAIGTPEGLTLQEPEVQNRFKISYYLATSASTDTMLAGIRSALADISLDADIVFSIDPLKDGLGLVDILPKTATKATAIEFLRTQEGLPKEEVIYCGDSGNDILPLTQCYRSILVNNAPADVKEKVSAQIAASACPDSLYIASGATDGNGNYASGILEGLRHFGLI